mmetsp:Transcript_43555/g.99085  ORF Transcript_43555/g.99085 Transcript_43555/m.99085 type:complete len:132 (-) Transcript_43555:63-458(-)
MRAMATQKKEEESNAQAKALKQYWGRIRSSISDQKQQRHHLAGESALRETEEDDKAERLQNEASSARSRESRRLSATRSEYQGEKDQENTDASAESKRITDSLDPAQCGDDCQQSRTIVGSSGDGSHEGNF